jgi:D-alanyl-D-alanine carboxypeptidase (penicillin-binding protein 5/6)
VKCRLLAPAIAALALVAPVLAAPPQVTGRAWLVENGTTGQVLLAHNAYRAVPIASLTKLMTVLLTLEHTKPNDVVTVSRDAAEVQESTVTFRAGERLTVRELLEAALIASANDAADALASYVGGSQARFVAMMNARARQLGLRESHFVRPDGLDAPGHLSSAHDVTYLARLVMHHAIVRQIVRMKVATISDGHVLRTWNDLLYSYPGIFGVKTGHTSGAGWNETAAAHRRGVSIYATLLGSPDRSTRNADLIKLLDWGFSRYVAARPMVKGRAYARALLGYGRRPLELVAAATPKLTVPVDRPLVRRVVFPGVASLPVSRGQSLGQVRIYQGSHLLAAVPLVAARSVSRPGVAGRVGWYATRTLHHMAGWFS